MSSPVHVRLDDPSLFGNDAAEDEPEDIFSSYVLERTEIKELTDASRSLCVVHAYKGEGKSAMLRLTYNKISNHNPKPLIISCTASDVAPSVSVDDYQLMIREWKKGILGRIAAEVGTVISVAWDDDSMVLVEEAERQGFRERNFVSSIIARLKSPKLQVGPVSASLPEIQQIQATNPERIINRWTSQTNPIWIIIDDIDRNFENTKFFRTKISSFFDACRELIVSIPQLRIRAAIRPNVWTTIITEYESLSKVKQYLVPLRWEEQEIRRLLAKRVEGYLRRSQQWPKVASSLPGNPDARDKFLIGLVFENEMNWGERIRPPHVVLHTLSKHRPRWVIELAKAAAKTATSYRRDHITLFDITENLSSFGRQRIEDTVAEFKSQCPEVSELITAFRKQKEQMSTDELLKLINNQILNHVQPTIIGTIGRVATSREVAQFLFEIGLFYGRRDLANGPYEHVTYSDEAFLLKSRTDIDAGLSWEIHPVFRQALEIRDSSGYEIKQRPRNVRRGRVG